MPARACGTIRTVLASDDDHEQQRPATRRADDRRWRQVLEFIGLARDSGWTTRWRPSIATTSTWLAGLDRECGVVRTGRPDLAPELDPPPWAVDRLRVTTPAARPARPCRCGCVGACCRCRSAIGRTTRASPSTTTGATRTWSETAPPTRPRRAPASGAAASIEKTRSSVSDLDDAEARSASDQPQPPSRWSPSQSSRSPMVQTYAIAAIVCATGRSQWQPRSAVARAVQRPSERPAPAAGRTSPTAPRR